MRQGAVSAAQAIALFHAEAVLLVHDDQAQVVKAHLVREQGVGTNHDLGGSVGELLQYLALSAGTHGGGQQAHTHTAGFLSVPRRDSLGRTGGRIISVRVFGRRHIPQNVQHRTQMLLGEHLGRGEHRGLAARIGNLQHGAQSHHGLTGTHITLQQAVHGRFTRQIRGNLSAHLLLPLGQLVGQNLKQSIGEATLHGGARLGQVRGTHRVQAGERALQHECLAVTHLRLRGTPGVLRVRGVQGAVRPLQGRHLAGATNRVGHRVFKFFERHLFEQLHHVAANAVGGQLHGSTVDGHGGGGGVGDVRAGGILREQGVVRVGEGVFAAVDADSAGEHHGFTLADFSGGGPGVEEGKLHLRADERTGVRHAGRGHAKEASLRKTILTKRVLTVAVCVATVGDGLHSPALCTGILYHGVLGSWVLRGVSERVDARVVHPGRLPALRGRTGYSGYAGYAGCTGCAGAVSSPGHHGYRAASPKTSGTKTGSPKTCGCVLPGGVGEPVGDGHFRDFAAARRHGSGAHVHHAGDDGDVLALNEFGEGAELTARQVFAREVFEHLPDGVQVQVCSDCLGAGRWQVLFERRIFDAIFGGVARQGTALSLRGS